MHMIKKKQTNDSSTMSVGRLRIKYFKQIQIFRNPAFFPLTADFISRTLSTHHRSYN